MAAGAVDREFLCIYRLPLNSLWDARVLLWVPLGRHWAPFVLPWCRLWPVLVCLGAPLGSLWLPLARLRVKFQTLTGPGTWYQVPGTRYQVPGSSGSGSSGSVCHPGSTNSGSKRFGSPGSGSVRSLPASLDRLC